MPDAWAGEYICIKYPKTEKTRLRVRLIVTSISELLSQYIDPADSGDNRTWPTGNKQEFHPEMGGVDVFDPLKMILIIWVNIGIIIHLFINPHPNRYKLMTWEMTD